MAAHAAIVLLGFRHATWGQEWVAPPVGIPANTPPVSPTSPQFVSTALPVVPQVCRLSLEDARQRALVANRALVLAHLNVDGKRYATAAATKDYYPKILGNVTYFHFDNPLGSVLTTRGAILPTTISANVLNQDSTLSTVFVAQPITKLIAVNALVRISEADEKIAQAKLDQGTKQLLSGVTQVYYGLSGALHIQAALQLQASLLEQQLALTNAPDLRIGLVELRQGLLQVQGTVRDLSDQLNDLVGLPPVTALVIEDPVPPLPPVATADQASQMAQVCNSEIREAEQTICKAEAALKVAHMDYLPDVNVVGGYANQTFANYIQNNFNYVGVTATYTFWEWGKKHDVELQRQTDLSLARQNLQVTRDKVELAARKSFGAFDQALAGYRLAGDMVQACEAAEKVANTPAALLSAKTATGKAQLAYMKAEIDYRVAHAQLMQTLGQP